MNDQFSINKIDNDFLDRSRHNTDALADVTISKIIEGGFEGQINQVFLSLVQNDGIKEGMFDSFDEEIVSILNTYFDTSGTLPDWANQELIKRGEKIFADYGPEIFMLLNVSSLPMCYSCANGAQVLYDTGRLMTHNKDIDPLIRRLMETAQMVVDVLSPGGLSPKGRGLITIQKVRLIHAAIRYYLKNNSRSVWDVDKLGEPINQEDLAGTLMSFGPVILSGLQHLNVKLSNDDKEAYLHCWKVVGHQLGIESSFLPETYDEAFQLATKILVHQAAESEAGKELTSSCISFMQYLAPGKSFDHVPEFLIDFFLKDFSEASEIDLSKCIGIPHASSLKDKIVLSLARHIVGIISHLEGARFIRKIVEPFNKLLLQGIINHYNGGKGIHFFIPPSLKKNWNIENS